MIVSGMSTLAVLWIAGSGDAECDDDGRGMIAVVAHAQREVLDAARRGEGRGLAMQDQRAAARFATPHLDGAPIGPRTFRLERLDGGFLRREARRKSRGGRTARLRLGSTPPRDA